MYVRQVNTLELDLFGLHYDANQKLIGMRLYRSYLPCEVVMQHPSVI